MTSDLDHFHPCALPRSRVMSCDDPISGRRGDSAVPYSFIYIDTYKLCYPVELFNHDVFLAVGRYGHCKVLLEFKHLISTDQQHSICLTISISHHHHHHHHNHFTVLFPGPPGWVGARRELLDFMVQGEINRGRHNDRPAGCHSIRTNQLPPPPSPIFFYRPDALPATQPTASKH